MVVGDSGVKAVSSEAQRSTAARWNGRSALSKGLPGHFVWSDLAENRLAQLDTQVLLTASLRQQGHTDDRPG